MTVVNPKSISGINSITTGSGSDDILTIHNNNGTERLRIDSTGTTKIVTGIVTTLTATSSAKVGSGVTLSPDGDAFFTGVCTATSFVGALPITNDADNKIITSTGSGGLNAENNLNYNGTKLTVTGSSDSPVVEFINTSGSSNEGDVLKLRASGRGGGVDDTDIFLITNDSDTRTFGVSNAGTVNTTGNIIMTSGKGIDFSATSDAGGMTSELLDDYEEGTWTPTFSSSGATFVYNHQYGYYQKVGDHVHVTFYITLSGTNSSGLSGNAITINLPFSASGSSTRFEAGVSYGMIYKIDLVGYGNPMGTVYQGNSYISVLGARDDNTGVAYSSDQFDASGCGISGSVTYKV
tara:strand:+ start:691 stop:1740 length:1050 start_codon:yes stop_codon:yes gene_type:complete